MCIRDSSKPVKKTVDEVVDKLEELQVVRACYDQWCRLQMCIRDRDYAQEVIDLGGQMGIVEA